MDFNVPESRYRVKLQQHNLNDSFSCFKCKTIIYYGYFACVVYIHLGAGDPEQRKLAPKIIIIIVIIIAFKIKVVIVRLDIIMCARFKVLC